MRSSTILIVNLRSLAQETIKNLVLAGIGRLIVSPVSAWIALTSVPGY
jgi:ubiquitin-like 1-activating enzyme E1 A